MENENTKQKTYADRKVRLKRALSGGFYLEAVLIEYAIFEDRSTSLLKHFNCKLENSRKQPLKFAKKLDVINDGPAFQNTYIKKRLPRSFIESIREWKNKRDSLIHDLMSIDCDAQEFQEIAGTGDHLQKQFDNAVKSIVKHFQNNIQ